MVLWWCKTGWGWWWWRRWWWWWWWWGFSPTSFISFCPLWSLWSLWCRPWCRWWCLPSLTGFKTFSFSLSSSTPRDTWSSLILGRTWIPSRDFLLCSEDPPSVLFSLSRFLEREWSLCKGTWYLVEDTRRAVHEKLKKVSVNKQTHQQNWTAIFVLPPIGGKAKNVLMMSKWVIEWVIVTIEFWSWPNFDPMFPFSNYCLFRSTTKDDKHFATIPGWCMKKQSFSLPKYLKRCDQCIIKT